MSHVSSLQERAWLGLPLALLSAAAFSTSGVFAKALFSGGWSPLSAVTARIAVAAVVLGIPAVRAMRGRWHLLRTNVRTLLLYGAAGVAGVQLFYFLAIQHLTVGVAVMIEYLSPVLLVLLAWATTRRPPSPTTVVGTVTAVLGLALVVDVLGDVRLAPIGLAFALASSVCSATYFLVSASTREDALPGIALTGFGLVAGLVTLLLVAATGVLPFDVSTDPVDLAGSRVNVVVPLLGIGVLTAAIAYASGVFAARILGARIASFVGLSEVIFAVLFAWLALDEMPRPVQLVGGALIVAGVVMVRLAERPQTRSSRTPASV